VERLVRWSLDSEQESLSCKYSSKVQQHVYAAARGIVVPSPALRDKLPPILGVPLSQLFTAEALDYRYQDNHHRFDRPQRKSRKAVSV
jgi:hypothetical protein